MLLLIKTRKINFTLFYTKFTILFVSFFLFCFYVAVIIRFQKFSSLGLDESSFDDSTSGSSLFRRDGLHLFGVDELSTKHIFAFFAAYNPYALEWINDSSCNLLWRSENQVLKCIAETTEAYDPDQNSSRRILSRPPKVKSKKIKKAKLVLS